MRTETHASPDDIDIGVLWTTLKRSLPRLLVLSAAAGGLTWGVLGMMAPRYTSEAQLSVVAKGSQNPFADPKRENSSPEAVTVSVDKEAINTHVRALMSPDLARRIADDMKLNTKKEFNGALGSLDTVGSLLRMVGLSGPRKGESEEDRVLSAFFKGLEVYSPKESRFIGVRFTSADPDLAAEIANRLADTYRGSLATHRVDEINEVQNALEPKVAELTREVSAAEAEVERFRGQSDRFVGGPQRTALIDQQLGELTAELTRTAAARAEVEGRAKSARELMKSGSAEVLPDVQRSPLIQNLVQSRVRAERQIAELSVTLLPGHPRMQQMNADLAGLKRQIAGEVAKLVEGLEKEAKAAVIREAAVQKNIDVLKSKVVNTGGDDVKLRQLEAAAKSKRAELERLQAQYEAAKARKSPGAVPVEAQIITQARPSSVPTFPKKAPYSGLVSAATLLFGLAWTISKALFTGARPQGGAAGLAAGGAGVSQGAALRAEPAPAMAHEAAPAAKRSASGGVASAKAAAPDVRRPAGDAGAAAEHERFLAVAPLVARLLSKAPAQGGYRVLVTGETAAVDPAAEAIDIAKALAAGGKQVILVDWATDGTGLAGRVGVARSPGLADLLGGAARFEDVIRREPAGQFHVLPAGAALKAAEGALDDDQLNLVLDALDEAYDAIVVGGGYDAVRGLFEAIQGRVDAGVVVGDGRKKPAALADPPGTLLGYEVTEIDIVRLDRAAPQPTGLQRIMRGGGHGVEIRTS